jgi:hypothetical protein
MKGIARGAGSIWQFSKRSCWGGCFRALSRPRNGVETFSPLSLEVADWCAKSPHLAQD